MILRFEITWLIQTLNTKHTTRHGHRSIVNLRAQCPHLIFRQDTSQLNIFQHTYNANQPNISSRKFKTVLWSFQRKKGHEIFFCKPARILGIKQQHKLNFLSTSNLKGRARTVPATRTTSDHFSSLKRVIYAQTFASEACSCRQLTFLCSLKIRLWNMAHHID